jgi:hypothetical protein
VFVGDAVLLFYSDGVEQLGTESAKKCLRWVSAIWYVLYCRLLIYPMTCLGRSLIVLSQFQIGPKHSRPAALRTTQSMASTSTRPGSAMSGSHSTTFLPSMESVPDLSDFRSLSGSSAGSLSRQPSLQSALLLMLQSPTKQSSTWIELRSRTCRCHHQRRFACYCIQRTDARARYHCYIAGHACESRARVLGSKSVVSVPDDAFLLSGVSTSGEQSTFHYFSSVTDVTMPAIGTTSAALPYLLRRRRALER